MKPIQIKSVFKWSGIGAFVFAGLIIVAALWEGFFHLSSQVQTVDAPGFHVLDLETPGLYAGVYQHSGDGPMPIEPLSRLDVRVVSKETYQEIPVMMNKGGQTFSRLGTSGMVVFNFLTDKPGLYTLSAVYSGAEGPTIPLILISQNASNLGTVLAAGGFFSLVFLLLGIYLIRQSRRLAGGVHP